VLLGANGCGKSTLARLACGLLQPASGRVTVDGLDTSDEVSLREVRTRVGLVMQDPTSQIVSSSVSDEIAFGPENLGLACDELAARVQEAVAAVGLAGRERREPHTLSGGEQQRLAIAGAFAMHPTYLVLDEPTAMLDSAGRAEVLAVLDRLRERGCGMLHITHDADEALRADRILVLSGGRIIFDGTPDELLSSPSLMGEGGVAGSGMFELASCLRARGVRLPVASDPHVLARAVAAQREGVGDIPVDEAGSPSSVSVPHDDAGIDGSRMVEPAGTEALVARGVSYTYAKGTSLEHQALQDVSLSVEPGEVVLVTGTTGCGKTTLLNVCAGLLAPDSGIVEADGRPVLPGQVGLVFQKPEDQLFAETVLEDVAFGPRNLSCGEEEAHARARHALGTLGIRDEELLARSPFSLSGGQARRVAIAGVLAMRSRYLLLDDPAAGLDAAGVSLLKRLVEEQRRQGRGIVIVTHDIAKLLACADRICLLVDGTVMWDGTQGELLAEPGRLAAAGLEVPDLVVFQQLLGARPCEYSLDPGHVAEWTCERWA
jgi:energy-coupling factor transporter ATP-binding protein EcfA2